LLAYNLIRVRMAQAAAVHGVVPRTLSFVAAKTLTHDFAPHLDPPCGAEHQRIEAELIGLQPLPRALVCCASCLH
jgi:hypothetical protein